MADPKEVSQARALALAGDAIRQAAESIAVVARVVKQFAARRSGGGPSKRRRPVKGFADGRGR